MSKHDDNVSMRHMLDNAREAFQMIQGRTRNDLDTDRMLQLALTRLVEIIGEAVTRVSLETRQRQRAIPWAEIIGLRNRLIHGYDAVDLNILWEIIQTDLPQLIKALELILEEGM
jgi:uncharacterized protein with HEPN domain